MTVDKKTAAVNPAAGKAGPSRLVAQLYNVRDYCKAPADIARSLKKIAKIGYSMVQISGIGPIAGEELAQACAAAGVRAVGAHVSLADWEGKYAEKLAFLKTIGCRHAAVPSLPYDQRRDAAGWKASARRMDALAKKLAKDGVVLQYHNHHFEFEKFGGKTGLRILYDAASNIQAEIDTCWVARGGGDPVQWIYDMKGRMDQIHLKDTVIVNAEAPQVVDGKIENRMESQARFAEIGSGNLNWPSILAACKKTGVKYYIVEQDADWIGGDPFKSLAVSYKFLAGFGLK